MPAEVNATSPGGMKSEVWCREHEVGFFGTTRRTLEWAVAHNETMHGMVPAISKSEESQ